MGKIRRKYDAEFKRQLVRQIDAKEITASEASRTHDISRSLIDRWIQQFHEGTIVDKPSAREKALEKENQKLKAKIGDLVMEVELLKKIQRYARQKKKEDTSVITLKNLEQFQKGVK
jgi:transposase-like protein